MAIDYSVVDALAQSMLDEISALLDGGASEPGYAFFTGAKGTDPNVIPAGTIIKWGNLNATSAFAAATITGTLGARKALVTLNQENATQNDGSGASFPETVGCLALFQNVANEASCINANLVIKGNVDVAANTPWCTVGSTTFTAGDVDITEGSCTIELPLTQST